jgi:amino acid transporter
MAYQLVGDAGVTLVSMAVMISTFGTLNGSMMTGPRIFFAMADDGLFFRKIASVHPRFQTPYVAITLAAVLAIGFVMARTFEQLAETFVIGIWPFYAGGVAAVYMLRRKHPDMIRSYKAPGYPVTPALFVVAALFVVGNAVWTDSANSLALLSGNTAPEGTGATLATFLIILLGIPAYLIWNRLAAPSGRS